LETILTLENLSKNYKNVKAVQNLSFTIEKGNVYGILGPNGSGKSTTLGMVLNVVNKTSGNFNWFDGTVAVHDALKRVGAIIERPKNSKFKTFSLGMKQRLAIASALLNDPEILILDEPTNGLDPQGIHQIREIIKDIATRGTTILLASHLLDEVEKVCSHVVVLRKGEKLYSGRVDEMISSHGFFELKTEKHDDLIKLLEHNTSFGNIKVEDHLITAFLNEPMEAETFNKLMFDKGIILSHLVKRKESLEEQFLTLTKNN